MRGVALALISLASAAALACAPEKPPFIRADPNPVRSAEELGRTVITWNNAGRPAEVTVIGPEQRETLFAAGADGSQPAPWIARGFDYEFRLYDAGSHTLLRTVTVARWNEGRWFAYVWALPLLGAIAGVFATYSLWHRRLPAAVSATRHDIIADGFVAAIIGAVALLEASLLSARFPNQLGLNAWFESDQPRILANMVVPGEAFRSAVHPLFTAITSSLVDAAGWAGADRGMAARTIIRLAAALTAALLFTAVRRLGVGRLDAVLTTLAFLCSAAFIHWFGLTETTPLGSCSIALVLAVMAHGQRAGNASWVVASASTLGITVTNWAMALAAGFFRLPRRRFLVTAAAAVGLVSVLVLAEKARYPQTSLFFSPSALSDEWTWTQIHQQGTGNSVWSPAASLRSLWLYTGVAPRPVLQGQTVTNQATGFSGFGPAGLVALAAWLLTIGAAATAAWQQTGERRQIVYACAAFLAVQSVLHSIYGTITFLYAAHSAPVFVLLFGFALLGRRPALGRAALLTFCAAAGWWNVMVFRQAIELIR